MANRTTPKKLKMGYELRINTSGEPGMSNWRRVGSLFNSAQEAEAYKKRRYADTQKHIVLGVNVSAPDKNQPRYMQVTEKPSVKRGPNNATK